MSGHIKNTSAIPGKITKIVVSHNDSYKKNKLGVYGAKGQEATTESTLIGTLGTQQTNETISFETGEYNYFLIDPSTGTGSAQMTSITIYYTSSSNSGETETPLTPEQFSWSAQTAEATLSSTFDNQPTLTNTLGLDVSYSSSTPAVATINATSGAIDLVGAGKTTISATFAGGEVGGTTYAEKTVSYTLTVKPAPLVIEPIVGGIVDILTIEDLKITGSGSYTYFTDKQASNSGHSNAVYAGTAARNGNSTKYNIQLNSGETSSKGRQIATTISGGIAKRVYVRWATQKDNTNNRYLTIYGKNEAYDGVETEVSGTEIGKITYTTGSAEAYVDLSSDCKYIKIGASNAIYMDEIQITWIADQSALTAPTFTPAAGTYSAVQNVTISAEEGTTIYYTLDGKNPTIESEVYSSAIEIGETTTVKAIAVKDEKVSPVATATYTINLPLTTMDQIFTKATAVGSTATSVEITFGNWVVSAVKEDGKTAFVTDGTKGFVIYETGCGFNVGDILSETAACKVVLFNGFAELTGLKSTTTGLSVATGGEINVVELDADGIAALTGVNTGSLVKINGICTQSGSNYYVAGVQVYSSLYAFGTLEVGAEYNITGIYQPYNSTKEILPRSAADIEKAEGLPTATISIADITMEVGETKTIEATITPDAAKTTVQYAITAGSEYIDLDGTTITAVAAGTATITATIAEVAGVYNGATKTFTATVKPQNIAVLPFTFNDGKEDIKNTLGMSQTGLDDDYGSAPKLKFNGAGDNVIVHFDSQPGEFSFLLKQNGSNAGTFTVYESANGEDYTSVWSGGDLGGNGQSATIAPTLSATARYVKFEYTTKGASTNYGLGSISIQKADHRAEAGIAWNPATVSLTVGDAFTVPTLSNLNGLTLTCTSDNENLATVTNAGVVTLKSGVTGKATITATFADGHADYKPAEATCVITVSPKSEKVVILAQYGDQWYALKAAYLSGKTDRLDAVHVDYFNGTLYNVTEEVKATIEWNSIVEGDKVSFLNDGKYLKGESSTKLLFEAGEDGLYQWDNTTYTMTIGTTVRSFLYNGEAFRNFAISNAGQTKDGITYSELPVVTAPVYSTEEFVSVYTRPELPVGSYGTICLPYAVNNYTGATFYEVAGKEGNKIVFDEVTELEAGKPYIFMAEAAEIKLAQVGEEYTGSAKLHNSLQGTFTQIDPAEDNILVGNYMVVNNVIKKCGKNCGLKANRAYFVAEKFNNLGAAPQPMPGRRRVTMGVTGENEATGVDNITENGVIAPKKLIENGQLIIIRDGVKYNVQGQRL